MPLALVLTGVCACFNWTITSSVLWPHHTDLSARSCVYSCIHLSTTNADRVFRTLKWRTYYIFPVVIFPFAITLTQAVLIQKFDAYSPADDFYCDITEPLWCGLNSLSENLQFIVERRMRFLGYAGVPWLLSLPCFIMSVAATVKVVYLHIQHRRLANMIYQAHISEPATSPDMPSFTQSAAEIRGEGEAFTPGSPAAAEQPQHFPSPQNTSGNEARPGTAKTGRSMASSVHHRHTLSIPPGPPAVADVFTPAIFRDTDEETIDDDTDSIQTPSKDRSGDTEWASWMSTIHGPAGGIDSGCKEPSNPHVLERWRSVGPVAGSPKMANAFKGMWRLFLFQGCVHIVRFYSLTELHGACRIFFLLDFMASLSTTIAWATGRPVPLISSHHIALLLLPWGPVIVFGRSSGTPPRPRLTASQGIRRAYAVS